MTIKYYLTKQVPQENYNIRLLVKAPSKKSKDKQALAIITDTEDHEEVKIKPNIMTYRLFGTSKAKIREYINQSIMKNRFEPLNNELLDDLLEDLENRINENILLDTDNGLDEYGDDLKAILESCLLTLMPKPITAPGTVEVENNDTVEDFLSYEYKQDLLDIQNNKLTVDNPKQPLVIDYNLLEKYDVELADLLIMKPTAIIDYFNKVIKKSFITEETRERFRDVSINARFVNIPNEIEFKNLKSNRIGEFITIIGTVKRLGEYKPKLVSGYYECDNCIDTVIMEQDINKTYEVKPTRCNNCNSRKFTLNREMSKYTDIQSLTIQEPLDNVISNKPREFEVIVTEDLVDTVTPGTKVKLTGIFTYKEDSDGNTDYLIIGNNIEPLEEINTVNISPSDEKKILEFANSDTVLEDLVNLFTPNLILDNEFKLGILVFMVKGIPIGTKRDWINILLIGDPATAKTQVKNTIKHLSLKCVTATGTGTTGKGLTYSTIKDNSGTWSLEAGAYPLANGGHIIIDEFDKLQSEAQHELNEALNSGLVEVNRVGFNTQLPARAGALCMGNPKGKRFDSYKGLKEQINIDEDVISRFDLTFILKDISNEDVDDDIFNSLFISDDEIDYTFLKKYLTYVSRLNPIIPKDVIVDMKDYYLDFRSRNNAEDNTIVITARQGEAIPRLAGAIAKLKCHDTVTTDDVDKAVELINYSLKNLEQIGVGKSKTQEDRELILKMMMENTVGLDTGIDKGIIKELFIEETGKNERTFYRRIKDLVNAGKIEDKGNTLYLL